MLMPLYVVALMFLMNIKKIIVKFQSKPLPGTVSFDDFLKYASYYGFVLVRSKGSHNMLKNKKTNQLFVVPTVSGTKVKAVYVIEFKKIINEE